MVVLVAQSPGPVQADQDPCEEERAGVVSRELDS